MRKESDHIELEKKTYMYWELSRCFQGRSSKRITTEKGLQAINEILVLLNTNRPLSKRTFQLQYEIIHNNSSVSDAVSA